MKLFFSLFILLTTSGLTLHSQVTIGMGEKPADGALLQLKQTGGTGTNASKGLGMPRVRLTDPKNLYPMFAVDPSLEVQTPNDQYNTTEKKSEQDALHIGLLVYNTNKCSDPRGNSLGLNVWDGAQWVSINQRTGSTVQGISGRVYRTAKFGDMEWMVENLEETQYDTQSASAGQTLPTGRQGLNTPERTIKYKVYYYPTNVADPNYGQYQDPLPPAGTSPTAEQIAHDSKFYNDHKGTGIGLIYSWAAATNDTFSDLVDANTPPPANAYGTVQGICPNGWRIPSDRDWLDLEKELSANPGLYSTQTTPIPWLPSYETWTEATYFRGTHGGLFKSQCPAPGYTGNFTAGLSKSTGFNLLLTGYAADNGYFTSSSYGTFASFWSSSNFTGGGPATNFNAWNRAFETDNRVARGPVSVGELHPVRCVKARN